MGLLTSVFGSYLLSKMAAEKTTTTEKLLEPKCDKIENQYVSSC